MSGSVGKKGKGHRKPVFIAKLEQMLKDSSIEGIFSWTRSRDCLTIKNVNKFTDEVLPKYFIHKNCSSFIRQLNLYGFRKITHAEGDNVYRNERFKMGGRHQRGRVCRRGKQGKVESQERVEGWGVEEGQLGVLNARQKNLEQLCNNMMQQNQKLVQEYQGLVAEYQRGLRAVQRRSEQFVGMLMRGRGGGRLGDGVVSISRLEEVQAGLQGQAAEKETAEGQCPLEELSRKLRQSEHFAEVSRIKEHIYARMSLASSSELVPEVASGFAEHVLSEAGSVGSGFSGFGDFEQGVLGAGGCKGWSGWVEVKGVEEQVYLGQSS